MVPVWMTFSDLFKVTIIQRQIIWKWYKIQLYLYYGRPLEMRKLIWSIERRHFQWSWTTPTSSVKVRPILPIFNSLTLNVSETVRHTDIVSMNRLLHTPYSTVSFRMIYLSDLEWRYIQNIQKCHEASCGLSATAELLVSFDAPVS